MAAISFLHSFPQTIGDFYSFFSSSSSYYLRFFASCMYMNPSGPSPEYSAVFDCKTVGDFYIHKRCPLQRVTTKLRGAAAMVLAFQAKVPWFEPDQWQPSPFFILFPKPLAIFTAFSVLQVHTIYRFLLTLCYVMLLNVLSLITRFFAKIISSCGSSVVRAFVIRRRPGCRFSGSWVRIPHHNTRCALGPS